MEEPRQPHGQATPTAGRWLRSIGEVDRLEKVTGLPVRDERRLPGEARPHPPVDCYAVAPASANTVAKLAIGIADNQVLTQVGEAIGTLDLPVVVFPRVRRARSSSGTSTRLICKQRTRTDCQGSRFSVPGTCVPCREIR
ncbi:MAG: flavoprotein [Streptomycetales bacterium]